MPAPRRSVPPPRQAVLARSPDRSEDPRSWGSVFDTLAEDYDRHRPAYPDQLIDRACEVGGLGRGDRVLEIGCGTGQLTASLLARDLRVTAVEPGERLISRARERLAGAGAGAGDGDGDGEVTFVRARLEEAPLPDGAFRAVFSASAIHWVDPDVGWRKLARTLIGGGSLSLLSYFGLDDQFSRADQHALRALLGEIAPELAAQWPAYRDLDTLAAGALDRQDNVSQVWAWLGGYELGRSYAAELFDAVRLTAMPIAVEQSADELNALLGTMSFWGRLSPAQRAALATGTRELEHQRGRLLRASTAACLVTARRVT